MMGRPDEVRFGPPLTVTSRAPRQRETIPRETTPTRLPVVLPVPRVTMATPCRGQEASTPRNLPITRSPDGKRKVTHL
jgi:hypothetical protein